jgi:CRP-like cAMP-binding protein
MVDAFVHGAADMDLLPILSKVELFEGLTEAELADVARICKQREYRAGQVITNQGEAGGELFVIADGFVEVLVSPSSQNLAPRTVVHLGRGQLFGEMALVDYGPRSATVKSIADHTMIQTIDRDDFNRLCDANHHLGFIVMRNMAADLSFKLRHYHLTGR